MDSTADETDGTEPATPDSAAVPGLFALPDTSALFAGLRANADMVARLSDLVPAMPALAEQMRAVQFATVGIRVPPDWLGLSSRGLMAQLRLGDALTPQFLSGLELTTTAKTLQVIAAGSALSSWRDAKLGAHFASSILPAGHSTAMHGLLDDAARFSRLNVALSEQIADLTRSVILSPASMAPANAAFAQYAKVLQESPRMPQAVIGARASHGIAGLSGGSLILAGGQDLPRHVTTVRAEVVEPWIDGPARVRRDLLDWLGELDDALPDLLLGAWVDVQDAGPAAVVKVASCAVEVLDRTLRFISPEAEVLEWHVHRGAPDAGMLHDSRPTHRLRIFYAMREVAGSQDLVDAQVRTIKELRSRLEAAKHASAATLEGVAALLVSAEAALTQLKVGWSEAAVTE